MSDGAWSNDDLQFPRLLEEIRASGVLQGEVMKELCLSMDLEESQVDEILERAMRAFVRNKEFMLQHSAFLEVEKTAMFSTAHITAPDAAILEAYGDNESDEPISLIDTEYGWRIYLGTDDSVFEDSKSRMRLAGLSAHMVILAEIAHEHGCAWLQVDQDGPVYDNLATFEW